MADGGEGTAIRYKCCRRSYRINESSESTRRQIESFYGILPDNTAIIEMAAASGLDLIKPIERNPILTKSYCATTAYGPWVKEYLGTVAQQMTVEQGCAKL